MTGATRTPTTTNTGTCRTGITSARATPTTARATSTRTTGGLTSPNILRARAVIALVERGYSGAGRRTLQARPRHGAAAARGSLERAPRACSAAQDLARVGACLAASVGAWCRRGGRIEAQRIQRCQRIIWARRQIFRRQSAKGRAERIVQMEVTVRMEMRRRGSGRGIPRQAGRCRSLMIRWRREFERRWRACWRRACVGE